MLDCSHIADLDFASAQVTTASRKSCNTFFYCSEYNVNYVRILEIFGIELLQRSKMNN